MSLPSFSIRRPVTVVMICIGVMMLGFIAWGRLPRELYPPISYPQLTIVTHYKDAAPEEIELLVTKPIEEVTGTVAGLKRISSISKEELSLVIAEFNWDTNMDFAALGVREKIDLIKERLPRGAEDPVVIKYNPFELPILVLNLSGDVNPQELLKVARKQVKTEIEKVEGVAVVNLSGGLEREILVEVDQGRLQAAGLPISNVTDALSHANLNYPAGTIKEAFYEYLIRTMGEFSLVKEIPGIAVGVDEKKESPEKEFQKRLERQGPLEKEKGIGPRQRLILLKDVALVKDTYRDQDSLSRFQGRDNISLSIQKQAGANTLQVVSRVQAIIKQIKAGLPPGVHLSVAYDQSSFIRESINGVRDAAAEGGLLSMLVLYLFLGNFWAALNVTFAIPISILATVGLMYFGGITINIISMGGLALAIGMLADAGTVVVESIDLKRRTCKSSAEAAVAGTEEIISAMFGTHNTTVVVFLPMVFVVGLAGQLFKQLAYTVTLSVYASLAVALSLTPLFASRIRRAVGQSPIEPFINRFRWLNTFLVTWFLRRRVAGVFAVLLLFMGSLFVFFKLDHEILPRVDQGQFVLRVGLPPGTRLMVTDRIVRRIEQVLGAVPEVKDVTVNIGSSKERRAEELLDTLGSHQAQILVNLRPRYLGWGRPKEDRFRIRRTEDVVEELKNTLGREPLEGATVEYLLQESFFKSAFLGGAPIAVEVKGTDLDRLGKLSVEVKKGLEKIQGLSGVQTSLLLPSPETKVRVLKDRAATYHLSVSDIALTAQTALKGFVASKFKEAGEENDIRVRLRKEDRENFNRVRSLLIHSPLEMDVPLAEVAYLFNGKGPTEIRRLDQQRTILVSAQLFQRPLGQALEDVNAALRKIHLPQGYSLTLGGQNRQMKESFQSLAFALLLSTLLVYMVMASEFESLWQPFLLMITIPMGIIGVVLSLWITHTPVGVMPILGIITLGGLVVDDGIILVDYINLLRRQGFALEEAVVLASERRLRPILMTSASTILGLLPLALGFGAGVELQQPMAITVMGGMTVCTFLTLIFVPSLYVFGEDILSKVRSFLRIPAQVPESVKVAVPERAIPGVVAEPLLTVSLPPPLVELAVPPEFPEIPENYGGEETTPDRPDAPLLMTSLEPPGPMEEKPVVPETPAPEIVPEPEPHQESKEEFPETSSEPLSVSAVSSDVPLSPRQQQLLDYLKEHGRITRKEFVDLTGASVPTAARDLRDLVDRGLIKGVGPLARGRYYVPS